MKRISVSIPWPLTATETREVVSFGFQTALVTYLSLYLLESLKPGFVTNFYSLDTFLWIVVVMGVLSSVWPMLVSESKPSKQKLGWRDWIWIGLLSVGTVAVVYYKTSTLGTPAKVIAPLSGLMVLGLCLLVYFDHDDDDNPETPPRS